MNSARDTEVDRLLARLGEGDRTAFTPLFRALWPVLLRLAVSMLKNEADAADAAQQALEKILLRASEYDPVRPALPWALGIAAWECRTLSRKRSRRREAPENLASEAETAVDEVQFAERELVRLALTALETLSEQDQQTLRATFLEQSTGAGGATFRKRRERALARLRQTFARLYGLG